MHEDLMASMRELVMILWSFGTLSATINIKQLSDPHYLSDTVCLHLIFPKQKAKLTFDQMSQKDTCNVDLKYLSVLH